MQILHLSIYTDRRRIFVITYLSEKKNTVHDSVYIYRVVYLRIFESLQRYLSAKFAFIKSPSSGDEISNSDFSVSSENDPQIGQDRECTCTMKTKEKKILILEGFRLKTFCLQKCQ